MAFPAHFPGRRPLRLLVIVVLLTLASGARADQVTITDEARRLFRAGVAHLDAPEGPRYAEAYRAFSEAYAEAPSSKILGNLGLCAMMLERDGEAIRSYERYLTEVDDVDPRERAQIERDLASLRKRSVPLTVVAPHGARIVDRRATEAAPVLNRYGPLEEGTFRTRIRSGSHTITIIHADREARFELEAEPGAPVSLRLPPAPAPEPSTEGDHLAVVHIAAITASAIGAAAATASLITGPLALERRGAYRRTNDGDHPAIAEAIRREGEALNVATDVLISAAVAGAVGATVLFVVAAQEKSPAASVQLAPIVGPSELGVTLQASF